MSSGYFPKSNRTALCLDNLHHGIITSSHILHKHGIFDAYGHISVRNPDNDKTFLMSCNMPPALLKDASEIVEYRIEDAEAVEGDKAKPGFLERYIHSELYKRYPGINVVLHSHATEVLAYTVNSIPLRPLIHVAGFLGPKDPPVWDIAQAYSSSEASPDLLVTSQALGNALASAFTHSTTGGFIMSTVKSALPNQIAANPDNSLPDHAVVLMRGHGFTTVATSLEAAVYQAIYTKEAAKVLTDSLLLQAAVVPAEVQGSLEGQVDVEGSGKLKGGKLKDGKVTQKTELKYLSEKEAKATKGFIERTMARPWSLWVREVEVDPLYQCNVERKEE